ncbi:MAG: phytanoyl-CoA dioxygenase family protein [Anaerolineae bacterium]|nr:phytanoyl-CoA dioxygenase family protein [Anaerolineae bacterium]
MTALPYTPLTAEQRKQFDEEGYLIVRNALDSDTIERLIEVGDRLIASDQRENRQQEVPGLYDGFRNVLSMDDVFLPLMTHPVTLPLVIQLLGANLQISTSHLIYRWVDPEGTPVSRRLPGWHRDNGRTRLDLGEANYPRMGLKCAFYLTDLSEPNSGATLLAPGSHLLKERIEIKDGKADPDNAIEPLLNPGDCVIFEYRTWHAGGVNLRHTRKAVMVGYGYRWLKPMDYLQQPPQVLEQMDPLQRFLVGERADDGVEFMPNGSTNPLMEWCEANGVVADRLGV